MGKRGLWDNIHAKRKRGESPAKPGDKGYEQISKQRKPGPWAEGEGYVEVDYGRNFAIATDFGDTNTASRNQSCCASPTRGVILIAGYANTIFSHAYFLSGK